MIIVHNIAHTHEYSPLHSLEISQIVPFLSPICDTVYPFFWSFTHVMAIDRYWGDIQSVKRL